jgi:hypothetical protein
MTSTQVVVALFTSRNITLHYNTIFKLIVYSKYVNVNQRYNIKSITAKSGNLRQYFSRPLKFWTD